MIIVSSASHLIGPRANSNATTATIVAGCRAAVESVSKIVAPAKGNTNNRLNQIIKLKPIQKKLSNFAAI